MKQINILELIRNLKQPVRGKPVEPFERSLPSTSSGRAALTFSFKLFSRRTLLILVLNLCPFFIFSETQYLHFDYARDMNAVQNLLKKEWQKLFLSPSYDEALIHKMFFKRRPGDMSVNNTTVTIDVLYSEGKLVGFVTYYYKNPNIGHLELLAIDSAFRKKGYGKYAIEQVTQECKKRGCTTLQLYVYTSNPNAIKFYEHLGFSLKANFGSYILLHKNI